MTVMSMGSEQDIGRWERLDDKVMKEPNQEHSQDN